MKLLKKISTKTVCGLTVAAIREKATPKGTPLFRVVGVAVGTKSGETDKGIWLALRGQFEAHNMETGEVVASGTCFLPDAATDMIAAQLSVEGCQSVQFAFDVLVKSDETAITGYVYEAKPLLEPSETDPISALRSQLPDLPKLEAPKTKD